MRQSFLATHHPVIPGKSIKSAIRRSMRMTGGSTTPLGGGVRG